MSSRTTLGISPETLKKFKLLKLKYQNQQQIPKLSDKEFLRIIIATEGMLP